MKKHLVLLSFFVSAGLGCSKKDEDSSSKNTEKSKPAAKAAVADPVKKSKVEPKEKTEAKPKVEPKVEPVANRLKLVDFPNTKLEAEVGQYAFAPNKSSFSDAHGGGSKHRLGTFSWGIVKIDEIGDVESALGSSGRTWKIPNSYILPIPAESTVAVGDIVCTSQYKNSFDRAIITAVGDKVVANFMRSMPFGEKLGDLSKGKYFKTPEGLNPGAPVAVRTSHKTKANELGGLEIGNEKPTKLDLFAVIRVDGDKVLLNGHMGKVAMASKAAVVSIPLTTELKKGDNVVAVWDTAHFMDGTILAVDKKLGHYEVNFPSMKKVTKVPFGEVLPGVITDYLK